VAELVIRRGLSERVVLSSFNPLCLWRAAAAAPSLRRGLLIDPDKPWAPQAYLLHPLVSSHSVHPFHGQCTPARVQQWLRRGLRVAVWTVDEPEQARALQQMGVSYLITNRPRLLREALGA
jgi:glycerophosphoryl diester phosphodiesterase